jgi:hypothetical protein
LRPDKKTTIMAIMIVVSQQYDNDFFDVTAL